MSPQRRAASPGRQVTDREALPAPGAGDGAERLQLYALMTRIRAFEEKMAELFRAGHIKGTAHSSIGQEAVAAGFGARLRREDYLVGHHRSHGHLIAKGARMDRMMAELLGRRTGYCRGLGGSMHIADLSLGVLGCNGVVGAGPALAVGAGLTSTLLDQGRIVAAFFGDGAAGQGYTHEAMNLAAVWRLPVVFICENNQFALTTLWNESRRVEDIAERAAAYGMPGEVVDGNDVMAVREAAERWFGFVRGGGGPCLIECKTYRRREHSMRANLPITNDLEVKREWEGRDPIRRLEESLLASLDVTESTLAEVRNQADVEVASAVDYGMASESASAEDLLPSVYAAHRPTEPEPAPGARRLGYVAALREAMALEMEADERVVLMGEDVRMGGIFRASEGLLEQFGPERVINTPISENGFVGAAVGAAMTGLRPIVEIQIFDFVTLAMDPIVNQAAKLRFMMGGTPTIPIVVRGPSGGGVRIAAQHSQSLEAWFAHIPGLVVAIPSDPYDAKGLLSAAIRDDNPVVFLEAKLLFFDEAEVPELRYTLPLGKARIVTEGSDVTVVATQVMVGQAVQAARNLEREGVKVEVIDPRTLFPLDVDTILASVRKTNRLVIAHEAHTFGGIGAEIAATIADRGFWDLDRPIVRVGAARYPMPYEASLEKATIPSWQTIVDSIRSLE